MVPYIPAEFLATAAQLVLTFCAAVIGCLTLFRKSIAAGFSLLTGRRPKASAETPPDEAADGRRKAA